MKLDGVITRFELLGLGDSQVRQVSVRPKDAECDLEVDCAVVLPDGAANIFSPDAVALEPAVLCFSGVRSLSFTPAGFELNATIVGSKAVLTAAGDAIEFQFQLTGGLTQDGFLVTLRITASGFDLRHRSEL